MKGKIRRKMHFVFMVRTNVQISQNKVLTHKFGNNAEGANESSHTRTT